MIPLIGMFKSHQIYGALNLVASLTYPAKNCLLLPVAKVCIATLPSLPCLCLVCIRPVPAQAIKTALRGVQQLKKPMDCREPQQLRGRSVETYLVPPNHLKKKTSIVWYILVLQPVVLGMLILRNQQILRLCEFENGVSRSKPSVAITCN